MSQVHTPNRERNRWGTGIAEARSVKGIRVRLASGGKVFRVQRKGRSQESESRSQETEERIQNKVIHSLNLDYS